MRETLEKYYSCDVMIKGINKGQAPKHERPVAENPVNQMPENARISGLIKTTKELAEIEVEPLSRTETSLLINVRGGEGFESIKEDHLIIQGKIDAKKGEEVSLKGMVYKYEKGDGWDYGVIIG